MGVVWAAGWSGLGWPSVQLRGAGRSGPGTRTDPGWDGDRAGMRFGFGAGDCGSGSGRGCGPDRARDAGWSGPETRTGPGQGRRSVRAQSPAQAGRRAPAPRASAAPAAPLPPLPRLRRERRAGSGILRPRRNWVAVPVVRRAAQAGPARPARGTGQRPADRRPWSSACAPEGRPRPGWTGLVRPPARGAGPTACGPLGGWCAAGRGVGADPGRPAARIPHHASSRTK